MPALTVPSPSLQPLPAFSRIPGLILPSRAFSNCLTVVEFLQSYGKVLGFDPAKDVPSLCALQEGLLGVGDSAGEVQDLLVRLLQAALYDPGLPPYCQVSLPAVPFPGQVGDVCAREAPAAAGSGQGSPDLGGAALAAASCTLSLRLAGSWPLAALGALPRLSCCRGLGRSSRQPCLALPGTPLGSFPLRFLALVFPSAECWCPPLVFSPPGAPPVG